jgi:hypothetical protein
MSTQAQYKHASLYNLKIRLPLISRIRRREEETVSRLIERYADPNGRALEIGPGTGFYTMALSRCFREVVAVEHSTKMTEILRARLAENNVTNVTVTNDDFRTFPIEEKFDVAIAIGVLDYIEEPCGFVGKMCSASNRAALLTAPQRGLWGTCFVWSCKFIRTPVFCHDRRAPHTWVDGWNCTEVIDVGLKTPLTKGMTLIAALEPA